MTLICRLLPSLPARGGWIEIVMVNVRQKPHIVPPRTGRVNWNDSGMPITKRIGGSPSPHGEGGLKFTKNLLCALVHGGVSPRTGRVNWNGKKARCFHVSEGNLCTVWWSYAKSKLFTRERRQSRSVFSHNFAISIVPAWEEMIPCYTSWSSIPPCTGREKLSFKNNKEGIWNMLLDEMIAY